MMRIRLRGRTDRASLESRVKLKIHEGTLLTTGIIIISTPASAIVLRIASINLVPKFAHWFPWIIQETYELDVPLKLMCKEISYSIRC